MLYEDLLTRISASGPCYRWLITMIVALLSLKVAFDMFILNLATASVPFHCAEVIVDNQTILWSLIVDNASFADNFSISSFTCTRPRLLRDSDGSLQLQLQSSKDNSSTKVINEACRTWAFLPSPPTRWTMFMEYSMVCDRQYLMNRMQTMLQLGICVSTIFGLMGDIVGRKPILVGFAYLDFCCNIAVIFVSDLTLQMALRFLMGFGAPALIIGIILVTELVAENYRGIHGNMVFILFGVGYSGSAAISYFIHNWRVQTAVACAIAGLGYATFIPVLPESPRWLLTRGYTKRAKRTLKEICRFSGCKEVLNNFNFEHNELVEPPEERDGSESRGEEQNCIFKILPKENVCRCKFLITLGIVSFTYFTVSLVYYAISFKRDFITKDIYLNVLIAGLSEIPATFAAWQLTNRAGRRFTTVSTLAFSGVGLICLPFLPTDPNVVLQGSSVLAAAIKFVVTVACNVLAVYGAEVLPTRVRSCSYFIAFTMTRTAQMLAPEFGGFVSQFYVNLAPLLCGSMSIVASLLILLLPETKDQPMPNIVAEMEPIGCPCQRTRRRGDTEIDTMVIVPAAADELGTKAEMNPLQPL